MTNIQINVTGSSIVATSSGKLTSGMVGVPVYIEYDSSWDSLTKTVSFRVGGFARSRTNVQSETTVPWEVMRHSGKPLEVGIEGKDQSGSLVMPTIWATVAIIYEGANANIPAAPNAGVAGNLPEVYIGPDEPVASNIKLWVDTDEQQDNEESFGGYYTPSVEQNATGEVTFSFSASHEDMPNVSSVTVELPKGADGTSVTILGSYDSESELNDAHPTGSVGASYLVNGNLYVWSATSNTWENVGNIQGPKGDTGEKGDKGDPGGSGFTGTTVAEINSYLSSLASAGEMTARFSGTYTVNKKIVVPEGMTIIGGTFVSDPTYEDALFSAKGDNVRLIGVTLKAPAHDKVPKIYADNNETTSARVSNVMGIFSQLHEGVSLIDCVCINIIPAKINYGSGIIRGCKVIDTPMFVYASLSKMYVSDNEVSICGTGLEKYYHVYYLDQNSELYAYNNRIICDVTRPFFDVYHLMTAGNTGSYHASGVVNGDVVIGNFQHIIDCHYCALVLKNCYIKNTNSDAWTEFSNQAHSTFAYHDCELLYDDAESQVFDQGMNAPVEYHNCNIQRTKPLSRRCIFKGCRIKQTLNAESALSNLSDVYDCEFHIYGTPTGIAIASSGTFDFDVVGSVFSFEEVNTNDYVMRCATSEGVICNNVVTGAKTTNFWYNNTEVGTCANNIVKARG